MSAFTFTLPFLKTKLRALIDLCVLREILIPEIKAKSKRLSKEVGHE